MEDFDSDSDHGHRRTRPHYPRNSRSSYHHAYYDRDPYDTRGGDGPDLRRARSSGHGPVPHINIYNKMNQEQDNIDEDDRGRGLRPESYMPGAYGRHSGRSRSRSAVNVDDLDYQRMRWKQQQREKEQEQQRRTHQAVDDFRRDEEARERERKELIRQIKLDEELHENERKELMRQAVRDEEEKKRKAAEDRKEMLRKARLEEEEAKAKEKKDREEMLARMKVEEQEKKDKEKAAWEEYERKKLEAEKKEKDEKEKKDKEYMERVTKDFARFGYREEDVQRVLKYDEEKIKGSSGMLVAAGRGGRGRSHSHLGQRPVFPKIHRHDVAIETLKYYDLDWEYDRANKDFIIILAELDEEQTDELFEHTRQLKTRSKGLLEDGRGRKDNDYVWIKKRGNSRGKSRDRSRHGGMRERFAESIVRRM